MKRSREPEEDPDLSSTNQQDVAIVPVSKIVGLDVDNSNESPAPEMKCSLPGHTPGLAFASYKDYESHYNKAHSNRCLDCRKNFPSSHILDLHVDEFHNVLVELKREKGEATYACFVETCDEKCKTPAERRTHLVEQHMYPANYFFAVTKVGIDRRQSMLVEHNQGKPQTSQRDGRRCRAQKADKKTSRNANANVSKDGGAGTSKDVPMREPDDPGHHGQAEKVSVEDNALPTSEPIVTTGEGIEKAAVDTEMEDLAGAISSLKFVPRAVRFGPRQRAGFAPW
ncbi:hypothetical protein VM1G_00692 [Cytospora mali]|uniref:C2H2-type domain-containing protein n=1 Tax=Cytospora mali TaxID=578113 RepID=A0A194VM18_CYTMA|nr:hypothetical protein VM1G_00692 [Valsa mali]